MQSNPVQIAELSAAQDMIERDALHYVFEQAEAQLYMFDAATNRLISANAKARHFCQSELRTMRRQRPWELLTGPDEQRLKLFFQRVRMRPSGKADVYVNDRRNGGHRYVVSIFYRDLEKPIFMVSVRDIAHFERFRDQAIEAQNRLVTAIESLSDGFVFYDADDRMVLCNDTYRTLYPASAPAMKVGATFEDILRYGLENGQYKDGIGREEEWLQERLTAHILCEKPVEQALADGRWLRIEERATADGGRVGLRVDITELKQQQQRLNDLALTDDLTGLRNRRNLAAEVAELAGQMKDSQRVAVVHMDLDRFKSVNDVFGHCAGDFVLRTCAEILIGGRAAPDIVARVGGDEFILAFVTSMPNSAVLRKIKGLTRRISEPISYDCQTCQVGASAGVTFLKTATEKAASDALIAADIALNHVKPRRNGEPAVFEPHMREQRLRNSVLAIEMQAAVKRGEFFPFFQPQINARSGAVTGFEALIRWVRPNQPAVPADEFLAIAQNAGLTDALDDIVMDQSCQAVQRLLTWGVDSPCVSINMSMAQISDANLIKRLTHFMTKHGIRHEHLRIELLESTLLDDRASNIIDNVHAMIEAGFRVELDDFGTGHAAIATLRKFAVSQIKIDRSLVRYIDQDHDLQMITSAIVELAQNLGISVLAEGVETKAEQDVLLGINCDAAQGYLHAHPMPLEKIHEYLIERGDIAIN